MNKKLDFEAIIPGMEITPLTKGPVTSRHLVMFAAATGEYPEIHYDRQVAAAVGLPDIIIQGWYKTATLAQMLSEWAGAGGVLKKISVQHREMDVVGNTLIAKGRVVGKFTENGENRVDCEIWVENQRGEKTSQGSAVVIVPA
jgi:acyl dehydratase